MANCSSNAIVSGGMGRFVGQSGRGRRLMIMYHDHSKRKKLAIHAQ